MPGFAQQTLDYRARNSNSVTVLLGDAPIGFAQSSSHSMDFGAEQLYGIGTAKPQEVQQLRISPQISLDSFALTDSGITVLGYPQNIATVLANNAFNLHITDGITGDTLFTYVGCVASSFAENISANQPVTDTISFLALDVLGPDGQSLLDGNNAYQIPGAQSANINSLGVSASVSASVNI